MIIIGEKINGAIPAVSEAIARRDADFIADLAIRQTKAGADYLDCAPSTVPELEYDAMCWLIDTIQTVTDVPLCIDSPDAALLRRILEEGRVNKPGMINSVSGEGNKCELILPLVAGSDWQVIGLSCDADGIPAQTDKKLEIAGRIIDKAVSCGVKPAQLHLDPCVMALPTVVSAMQDLSMVIGSIHDYAPGVKATAAISNISFGMPARRYVNCAAMAYAMAAGLDSAILDPCNGDMMGMIYACEALLMNDRGGRRYNRAWRQGRFGGQKK